MCRDPTIKNFTCQRLLRRASSLLILQEIIAPAPPDLPWSASAETSLLNVFGGEARVYPVALRGMRNSFFSSASQMCTAFLWQRMHATQVLVSKSLWTSVVISLRYRLVYVILCDNSYLSMTRFSEKLIILLAILAGISFSLPALHCGFGDRWS